MKRHLDKVSKRLIGIYFTANAYVPNRQIIQRIHGRNILMRNTMRSRKRSSRNKNKHDEVFDNL